MKKLLLLFVLLALPILVFGQPWINNFDQASPDTNYWAYFDNQGGQHYQTDTNADSAKGWIIVTHVTDPVHEGAGAMKLDYSVHNAEGYGGYTKLEHWNPDSNGVYNWSGFDSVMIWYYNAVPQSLPGRVNFRFCLSDVSDGTDPNTKDVGQTEYYYSFHYVLDNQPGWNRIAMPLLDGRNEELMDEWNGEAFNRTGWAGIQGNDVLDLDKIRGFSFEFSISGAGEGDFCTGTIILDHMTLFSPTKRAFVFFNGRSWPNTFASWAWGQSSVAMEEGAGTIEGTNAIKWVQGNEWGNGWTGIGFTITPAYDMTNVWETDSLKLKVKTDEGVGPIRVQLEDGAGKVGAVFQPVADQAWHSYAFKLSELVNQDGTTGFNPANMIVFGVMAEASGIAGKVLYLSDIWTGNPKIDVVAPKAPLGLTAIPAEYYNLVIWEDVPGEEGEAYTVYASDKPITDLTSADVKKIGDRITEGTQTLAHYLYYPLKDKVLQQYYAVTCKDAGGNISPVAAAGPFSNAAKGIATISLNPPPTFAADGDLSEWDASGIKPFILKPSESHWSLGTFDNDADLTATCYFAVDDQNLYIGLDVIDNVYSYDPAGDFWQDDVFEIYMGLYNETTQHVGFKRGAEPDYKFITLSTELISDPGYRTLATNDSPNYKFLDFGASDYAIEMKIPLDTLNSGPGEGDARFHPLNGMKIRMDINVHDADTPNLREGILSFSNVAQDNSWEGPQNWGLTWVGDTTEVVTAVDNDPVSSIPEAFSLSQNYPNPFNPTTTITYSVPTSGMVKVEVFNRVGQKVTTLVNGYKAAGSYKVDFSSDGLPSGVYFYRLEAGGYSQTMKMILMK